MKDLKKLMEDRYKNMTPEELELIELEDKKAKEEQKRISFENKIERLLSSGLSKRHLKADISQFSNVEFGEGESFLIVGAVGSGKTWLSHGIAKEYLKRGLKVSFLSATNLNKYIVPAAQKGKTPSEQYKKTDLVIIDDLGIRPLSELIYNFIYDLIWDRYNDCKATVITTSKDLKKVFNNDEAMLSRISQTFTKVDLGNTNYRAKFKQRHIKL